MRQARFQLASTELTSFSTSPDNNSNVEDELLFLFERHQGKKRKMDEIRECYEKVIDLITKNILSPNTTNPVVKSSTQVQISDIISWIEENKN